MGCDYYILKVLKIRYKNGTESRIILKRDRGYYFGDHDCDSDDSDYEESYERWIKQFYEVTFKPIRIYSDNSFKNELVEVKYRKSIHEHLIDKKLIYDDILDVYKAEVREPR
jgi:hypothetical protein